jgi:hypothetical protein
MRGPKGTTCLIKKNIRLLLSPFFAIKNKLPIFVLGFGEGPKGHHLPFKKKATI